MMSSTTTAPATGGTGFALRELKDIHPDLEVILLHLHRPAVGASVQRLSAVGRQETEEDRANRAQLLEFFLAHRSGGAMTDSTLRFLLGVAGTRDGRRRLVASIRRSALDRTGPQGARPF